jgi:hypothetical protein
MVSCLTGAPPTLSRAMRNSPPRMSTPMNRWSSRRPARPPFAKRLRSPTGTTKRHDAYPLPAQHAPNSGYDTADPIDPNHGTRQLTGIDGGEALPDEVVDEAAIDQCVHRGSFIGEQGIDHVCRNTVPA